jgi:hypothetical protein
MTYFRMDNPRFGAESIMALLPRYETTPLAWVGSAAVESKSLHLGMGLNNLALRW